MIFVPKHLLKFSLLQALFGQILPVADDDGVVALNRFFVESKLSLKPMISSFASVLFTSNSASYQPKRTSDFAVLQ